MRRVAESSGIERLATIREEFRGEIYRRFEHRAKLCSVCQTPGDCCLDEHFVNVRVSRLEAAAIRKAVGSLGVITREAIGARLEAISPESEFYACPLYQPGVGCLVHDSAKPLPCIAHACYDRPQDLPPEELLSSREMEIDDLNRRVYGRSAPLMPIHSALR